MGTFGQLRLRLTKSAPGLDPDLLDGFINDRYQEVLNHIPWSGLRADAVLQTVAAYDTGTVSVNQGSRDVYGAGTSWSADLTGRKIRIGSDPQFYAFTYTSGSVGVLDRPYEGEADAAESEYSIWQNVYSLPSDLDSTVSIKRLDGESLDRCSGQFLDSIDPGRMRRGEPVMWAPAPPDPSAPSVQRVELLPIPVTGHGYPLVYGRVVDSIGSQDTAAELLGVVRDNILYVGVRADILSHGKDYAGAQLCEARFAKLVADARASETARRPPARIGIASRFTRHQARRWQR